jgi:hypothetical protein
MARAAVNLPSEQITDTSLKLPVSAGNLSIGVTSVLAVLNNNKNKNKNNDNYQADSKKIINIIVILLLDLSLKLVILNRIFLQNFCVRLGGGGVLA